MTSAHRILEAIRDAADPFDAPAEDVLKRAGMDRAAFVKAVGGLEKSGLVNVDDESGALRLTDAGAAELDPAEAAPPPVAAPVAPARKPDPEPVPLPAAYTRAGGALPEPTPAPEPPTTEPVVGQLDLLPATGMERIPGEPVPKIKRPARAKPKAKKPVKAAGKKAGKVRRR